MTLIIKSGGAAVFHHWQEAFAEAAPDLPVRLWSDPTVDPADIRYAMVWDPEPGRLAQFPNLKLIIGSGAGVERIVSDPHLPAHVPLLRMTTPETAQIMGEYVCWAVLSLMRRIPQILADNAVRRFDETLVGDTAADTRVGIMGLGALGARAAEMLVALGFPVAGWSTRPKAIPGVESFVGDAALPGFLARSDIVVCLLPLTPATTGILRAETLALLPRGAGVVNAGRGPHVVQPDLIAALDSGHLRGAVLDVFPVEPLPPDDPAWAHPAIITTPHVASFGSRRVRARHVGRLIAAFEASEDLPGRYDPARGY
jgi:glyoxylate/hydroxypyruvate reductase A